MLVWIDPFDAVAKNNNNNNKIKNHWCIKDIALYLSIIYRINFITTTL